MIPVFSGFQGKEKRQRLRDLMENQDHRKKILFLLNDFSDIHDTYNFSLTAEFISKKNGCKCCLLRYPLVRKLNEIYRLKEFDSVIMDSSHATKKIVKSQTNNQEARVMHSLNQSTTCIPVKKDSNQVVSMHFMNPTEEFWTSLNFLSQDFDISKIILVNLEEVDHVTFFSAFFEEAKRRLHPSACQTFYFRHIVFKDDGDDLKRIVNRPCLHVDKALRIPSIPEKRMETQEKAEISQLEFQLQLKTIEMYSLIQGMSFAEAFETYYSTTERDEATYSAYKAQVEEEELAFDVESYLIGNSSILLTTIQRILVHSSNSVQAEPETKDIYDEIFELEL